jgi:hypothetical protein
MAPIGVVAVYRDGHVVPLTLVYVGVDEDGLWVWEVADPLNFDKLDSLRAAVLPARTSIRFREAGGRA